MVASATEVLSVSSFPVCPHQFPRVCYWRFPHFSVYRSAILSKVSLMSSQSHTLFLERSIAHSISMLVYTDGSKLDAVNMYGVVISLFFFFFVWVLVSIVLILSLEQSYL